MKGILCAFLIALLTTAVLCIPEERLKRSYEDGRGPTGYGGDSDEHDASLGDHAPCGVLDDSSPEFGYDYGQRPGRESNRGYSVKAAAAASSSTYS